MPEGPSIVILKELVQQFKGKKIVSVNGNSKQDIQRLAGQKIVDFKSWGKHFLLCFKKFTVRIHFMLFGSYSINEKIERKQTRLGLHFKNGDLYFYACSVKFLEEDPDEIYDWSLINRQEAMGKRQWAIRNRSYLFERFNTIREKSYSPPTG